LDAIPDDPFMAGLRSFSDDIETLASAWRARAETTDEWRHTSVAGSAGGEASGYFVTSGALNGYAKPSKIDTDSNAWPRACHEKIASDLAFDLGLPLVPVLLHRWRAAPPQGDQPFVAISLFPFLNTHKWQVIEAVPALAQQMKLELKVVASALIPFDTWLDNGDRVNAGNLLVSKDQADPTKPLRIAYIDYANSMLCVWRNSPFTNVTPRPVYPTDQSDVEVSVVEDMLKRIESLSVDPIKDIVTRIPGDFATDGQRRTIIDGLLDRQSKVRSALKAVYGGIS
jgi:hypothetical protein